jgi:very-short-patch-repair endonuclease
MAHEVSELLGERGWITGPQLLGSVSRSTVGRWVSAGALVRLAPAVFALPAAADDWRVRVAAALHGRDAVASHATALALWELAEHPPGPVHITVPRGSSTRGTAGVSVHRVDRLVAMRAGSVAVSPPARAVVDSWGAGSPTRPHVRAAAIDAVRRRLCSPRDLARELGQSTRLRDRAELIRLTGLLADGCRSELEIWGCLEVLRGPGMPAFVQQLPVTVDGTTFLLDAACEESMLAVEMDGAAWHGSKAQRERDIRRDALVATTGWQTLRFSYTRLTGFSVACQREILAVHAARLRMLGADRVR